MSRPAPPPAPRGGSGVVLRTLTEDERSRARQRAWPTPRCATSKSAGWRKRKPSAATPRKASSRPSAKPPRPAARPRKSAIARTRKPSARPNSKPRSVSAKPRPRPQPRPRPRPHARGAAARAARLSPPRPPTRTKVRARSVAVRAAPSAPSVSHRRPPPSRRPQKQRGRLTLVTALTADDVRERSIASFRRRTQRLKGHAVQRAEGKADSRSGHSGSDHHPGTRQPHVRARGRRHPPADEAGRDAQDHRRDRCRHRAADRRGTRPHRQARRRVATSRKACSTSSTIPPIPSRARRSSP